MRILNSLINKHLLLTCFLVSFSSFYSQKIISGPIQGNTTDSSATFWLLTKKNATISIKTDDNSLIYSSEIKEDLFVDSAFKKLHAYTFSIYFNKNSKKNIPFSLVLDEVAFNHSVLLSSKTDSSFFFGSCAYIGKGVSRIYRPWNMTKVFKTMSKDDRSKYMVWMGDNVYLLLNHDLKNNYRIYKRYIGVRKQKNMNRFLSSSKQHYATWDDHDFGPNNCDGTFVNAHLTTNAFRQFWPNPKSPNKKGVFYSFKKGDVSFFMTDGRTFKRTNDTILLGRQQLGWLKKELVESTSTFKVIVLGNQLINKGKHESYYDFKRERNDLIKFINDHKVPGVIFFSGDRHHTEINIESHQNYYPIHDITCSALSSPRRLHSKRRERKKDLSTRVSNSFIVKHNYGLFKVMETNEGKSAQIQFLNKYGKIIYSYTISTKTLGY